MNWHHLSTVLWLRWRVAIHQLQRGGIGNTIILGILAVVGIIAAAGMAIGGFFLGQFPLSKVPPVVLLLVWDGVIVTFLLLWLTGVVTELQRSEVFSPSKFLHLPVSLSGVFLINYVSSLVRLSLILFVPGMVGLSIGLVASRGPSMLWLFPLLAGFFLMVTAVTYQFQGWLGALMANPRRRRTVIVVTTIGFLLLTQLPNLLMQRSWRTFLKSPASEDSTGASNEKVDETSRSGEELNQLIRQMAELQVKHENLTRGIAEAPDRAAELEDQVNALRAQLNECERKLDEYKDRRAQAKLQALEPLGRWTTILSAIFPPGWLPLGVLGAARGSFVIPTAALFGMIAIGMGSLWRGYHMTLRFYTGQLSAAATKPQQADRSCESPSSRTILLERRLFGISEHASAVALASFQSLLRAPEAKMMLLTPLIMVIVGASIFVPQARDFGPTTRAVVPFSTIALVMFSLIHFVGNQFGYDRAGFRVFILAPVPRRDVLLGKNLGFAPMALILSWTMLLLVQFIAPVRWDHFLAMIPQSIVMYLILCMMANFFSILAPMPIAAGSMRVMKPTITMVVLQILFALAVPFALLPALLPLAVEWLLSAQGWRMGIPICLLLSIGELLVVLPLYRWVLAAQGELLQGREQKILDVVTRTE